MSSTTLESIREHITDGSTDEAFELLADYVQESGMATSHKNRFYSLSNQQATYTRNRLAIGTAKPGIENAIVQRLLKFLEELEKNGASNGHTHQSKENGHVFNLLNDEYGQSLIVAKEAERQKLVLQAKTGFLNQLSTEVWDFLLKLLNVAYDKAFRSSEQFQHSFKEYDAESWNHLSRIKGIIGGAVWFTEEHTQNRLNQFYNWLLKIDVELGKMAKTPISRSPGAPRDVIGKQYGAIYDAVYSKPDQLFRELKKDFEF